MIVIVFTMQFHIESIFIEYLLCAADFLSSMLELEVVPVKHVSGFMHLDADDSKKSVVLLIENLFCFKGERANCSKFAEELASGVDIIVNDAFSESHKVIASTVGAARFCYACIAGFYFEESLYKLKKIIKTTERPYMAIVMLYSQLKETCLKLHISSKPSSILFIRLQCFMHR